MSDLEVIIPAYKSMFFPQTLLSIANQTNKKFTLYIGDDCSSENLYGIVYQLFILHDKFINKLLKPYLIRLGTFKSDYHKNMK
jgi:glycosyltransferase involved in cell wall biosynthesis